MNEQEELLHVWSKLDEESRHDLLVYAMRLSERQILRGGPYDGLRLDPAEIYSKPSINVKHTEGAVAVYVADGNFNYDFARYQKMGEGCMPDLYPNRGAA